MNTVSFCLKAADSVNVPADLELICDQSFDFLFTSVVLVAAADGRDLDAVLSISVCDCECSRNCPDYVVAGLCARIKLIAEAVFT